jgi:hypothetical protein
MEPDDNTYTITLDSGETIDLSNIIDMSGYITIDLNNTHGATTTYLSDTITNGNGSFTITGSTSDWVNDSTFNINSIFKNNIDQDEVERMCKEYPGLEKVWQNFKTVYEMVKQDYEGKKKAGELDDDNPL